MIPHQNVNNLTLNDEVVEAVEQGKFHIYPVKTIDEGIEILTGVAAGEIDADGKYAAGTIHHLVSTKLEQYTNTLIEMGKFADGEHGNTVKK